MSATHSTFFRSATIGGRQVDLQVADGRIAAVGPDLDPPADAVVEDLGGAVVVPGLVDAHAHLDKTLRGGPWVPHSAPPGLSGKIQAQNSGFSHDEDIALAVDAATYGGARLCGLERYGLAVGDVADFVAIPGRNVTEVVALRPARSLVVKAGRVVARNGQLV